MTPVSFSYSQHARRSFLDMTERFKIRAAHFPIKRDERSGM